MPRNKYPEQTVEKILDAAARLFQEKGYQATTLQDIIDTTKLSKGAVYHHFRSKQELARKVGDRMGNVMWEPFPPSFCARYRPSVCKRRLFMSVFFWVVCGQVLSLFGNAALRFALPLWMLRQTGSAAAYGAVTALAVLDLVTTALTLGTAV